MAMKTLTVSENIINHIRGEIVTGSLTPGTKLKENDLSMRLSVSTAPIREALRVLQNEYLVKAIPRKGTFVTEISIEDCHQINEVRKMIECSSLELLERNNITDIPHDIESIILGHEILPGYVSQEIKNSVGLSAFHFNLVELSGNEWLFRLYKSIAPAIVRYQFISYVPGMTSQIGTEHHEISSLIRKGSYSKAKEMLSKHIQANFEIIANNMIKKM